MNLITFQKLGENRNTPRLWIESQRLTSLGFYPGVGLAVEPIAHGLRLRPSNVADNHVSQRRDAGQTRPIIDIENRQLLSPLDGHTEIKVRGTFQQLDITPSVRSFHIHRHLRAKPPFETLEVFSGGGTLSQAVAADDRYQHVAGVEVEPKFADVWQYAHPQAMLYQADVRMIHPSELPPFTVGVFAIPCTSHCNIGRAKKSLAGKPELGDTGDLYMSVANIIAARMPLACVFENVPGFATSLAGQSLLNHLRKLGYHIEEMVLDPHGEWNEPQDRKRWVAVATLREGFKIASPKQQYTGDLSQILDAPGDQDKADADRIANTIVGLRRHNARHQAMGHGFGFTTINHQTRKVPTLVRSYHKINTGPFVETPHGLRMLRQHEAEKLMGAKVDTDHYATAIEILGQGVQTRVFKTILNQLADYLTT